MSVFYKAVIATVIYKALNISGFSLWDFIFHLNFKCIFLIDECLSLKRWFRNRYSFHHKTQFYHEDFKAVMPVCTQQSREEELNVGIMSKRPSWAGVKVFWFFFPHGEGWGGLHAMHTQSCLTLCDPMDGSPLAFSFHGISQARILEWISISFSRGSSPPRSWMQVSYISCISNQVLYQVSHQ